jgi:predicted permease
VAGTRPHAVISRRALHSPRAGEILAADLRLAFRMIRRNPAFVLVSVLCIAIGTGAVTTIFSSMNALMLRPLPGTTDGARLLLLERKDANGREGVSGSYNLYDLFRTRAATLDGVAAWSKVDLSVGPEGDAHSVYGNIVSASYFTVLGVRPGLGRFFAPAEDLVPNGAPVVVVSYGFWKSRLGGDPDAVGRPIAVNGHPYTLIGVTPPGFVGVFTPLRTDAWVPLAMQPQLRPGRNLGDTPWLWLFGRLKTGATSQAAIRELSALTAEYSRRTPEPNSYTAYDHILASPLTGLPSDARTAFFGFAALLLTAALLVLLIASVNVASLLSARGVTRGGELAVRSALGAGRARLAAQLLTEVVVLFMLGGTGGLLIAYGSTRALERLSIPGSAPIVLELTPDLRVLAFALLLSLLTGVLFGLPPVLAATRIDLTTRLRTLTSQASPRRRWLSRSLIAGQLALSLVLLVSAGLFGRALVAG